MPKFKFMFLNLTKVDPFEVKTTTFKPLLAIRTISQLYFSYLSGKKDVIRPFFAFDTSI